MTNLIVNGNYREVTRYTSYKEALKAANEIHDQTGLTVYLENALGDIVKIVK